MLFYAACLSDLFTEKLMASELFIGYLLSLIVRRVVCVSVLLCILDEIEKISLVDLILPTKSVTDIKKRCITQPTEHQQILLQYLKLNLPRQFTKK
ncbi:MAG: hypothetical protein LBQ66_03985 [Planctomycetaceae bacterium]|nr:hypothetical protein [Planctomycetaceae bacterium]